MTSLLAFLLALQLVLPTLLYLGRNRLIFIPSTYPSAEAGLRFLRGIAEVRLIHIVRPDGRRLAAYDARPEVLANPGAERLPVVLFFHGNAGNLAYRATLAEDFAAHTGARTVFFDYSGYGGNDGSPSEEEVTRDGLAAYDHLVAEGVDARRIVLYGESLGSAVALAVAAERPCAGVVLQSAFASLASMAWRLYPWLPLTAVLARGSFPSEKRIAELDMPILMSHGAQDRIVPIAEGRRLHRAAPAGTEFLAIEDAGHNDFFAVAGDAYLRQIGERLRRWTRDTAVNPP